MKEARELALSRRHEVQGQRLSEHTRELGQLGIGTVVQVQNQAGSHKDKWDLSGTVVEELPHNAYQWEGDETEPEVPPPHCALLIPVEGAGDGHSREGS